MGLCFCCVTFVLSERWFWTWLYVVFYLFYVVINVTAGPFFVLSSFFIVLFTYKEYFRDIHFAVYYERKVLNGIGNRKIARNFCEHIVSSQKLRAMFELSHWKGGMIKYIFNKVIIKCLVSNRVKPFLFSYRSWTLECSQIKVRITSPRYDAYHLPIIFFGFFRKK